MSETRTTENVLGMTIARDIDRRARGSVISERLSRGDQPDFLPGVSSEVYFGEGKPVLGVRCLDACDAAELAYRAHRLTELAACRSLAVVVLTGFAMTPWERHGLRCEFVPYGRDNADIFEASVAQLWDIDMVLDYADVLRMV